MNLLELAMLYGIGGLISAFVLGRRDHEAGRRTQLQLVLALLLWPLWLPVALTRKESEATFPNSNVSASEQALRQGYEAFKGTPLEKLLPLDSVERISLELRRVVERDRELAQLLTQPSFDLQVARARVSELERIGAQPRALVMAQRHVENVERLAALHQRDQLLNAELGDWLSILRRFEVTSEVEPARPRIYGALELDPERHEARYSGQRITLTATEFALLVALYERPGVVLSRTQLMDRAYPGDVHVTERTLDTHVRRIRAKFRVAGGDPIATVHGVGYKAVES